MPTFMPDGYEVEHGLNPVMDDTQGDIDGDGQKNIEEYEAGTDLIIRIVVRVLSMTPSQPDGAEMMLTWVSAPIDGTSSITATMNTVIRWNGTLPMSFVRQAQAQLHGQIQASGPAVRRTLCRKDIIQ